MYSRRTFCIAASAALAAHRMHGQDNVHFNVPEYDRAHIISAADQALAQQPQTVTTLPSPIKNLDPHQYYSQDTEWFAKGDTYEHRIGRINPTAFTAHRDAFVAMNGAVAACTAAWRLTADAKYANHALAHLRAWFLDPATRMEPDLENAASVPTLAEGSARGVEETVALAETVRSASFLCAYNGVATEDDAASLRKWCSDFATWLNESKKGTLARDAKDQLAICWTLQAAECARFARMGALQLECSHRFRDRLLRQMNFDGQFEPALHRPDAFRMSIFTLDCLSLTCEVISSPLDRLWDYTLPDGRGLRSAIAFLFPSLENRAVWKLPADAEHFKDLPARQPSLLFAGRAYGRPEYIAVWKRLPVEPGSKELLRYFPVRQPALWTVRPPA